LRISKSLRYKRLVISDLWGCVEKFS